MKKTPILSFTAGAAAGCLVMWLIQSSGTSGPEAGTEGKPVGSSLRLLDKKEKLTARMQALEKQLKEAKAKPGKEVAEAPEQPEAKAFKGPLQEFDAAKMEEMMRKGTEREVSREVDRMALRLKLTPEQKDSLKAFLTAQREQARALFTAAMKDGKPAEIPKSRQNKDEFLKTLLTPEQQTDYAKSQEEQRTAKAEEYAQRKVRKLNNDLNLSEEQKDKLFQAYAHQKMTAKQDAGDVVAGAGGTIAFATVGSSIGDGGPVEFELDSDTLFSGGGKNDLDRTTIESVLTPEQLAVYDLRKAEEQEQMKVEGGAGGLLKTLDIRVGEPSAKVPPPTGK